MSVEPSAGLIFDVGMHKCEDTDYYLAKGFSVVAVEAVPEFCQLAARDRFEAIASGRLVIENVAITSQPGPVQFYTSTDSVWGTIRKDWVKRNERMGHQTTGTISAQGVTLSSLVKKHGIPYYVKIDIEGADLDALASLAQCDGTPAYVSIESEKVSWRRLLLELRTFHELGYRRFQIVNQYWIKDQALPNHSSEGRSVAYAFSSGSSGAFGADLGGRWMGRVETTLRYAGIFFRYRVNGDRGVIHILPYSHFWYRVSRRLIGEPCWFDTHATTKGLIMGPQR